MTPADRTALREALAFFDLENMTRRLHAGGLFVRAIDGGAVLAAALRERDAEIDAAYRRGWIDRSDVEASNTRPSVDAAVAAFRAEKGRT